MAAAAAGGAVVEFLSEAAAALVELATLHGPMSPKRVRPHPRAGLRMHHSFNSRSAHSQCAPDAHRSLRPRA